MSHQSELIRTDINAYLAEHERKELLRFLTCGNVDDGKSTLIGRLLHDSKMIYEDQLAAIRNDSLKCGTTGAGRIDLALLVDGLQAEREQGITIDVAYRFFSTSTRKFIIADTPGHEQYTRNMATGASTCDLAIILIDARYGVQTQTRRHSFIASLLGIRHILVAVNKMDLVAYSEDTFNRIRNDYLSFVEKLDLDDIHFIPISALDGDNVVHSSENMPWYAGKPLMEWLNTIELGNDRNLSDARLPVQYVNRPHLDFRGFCGTVASGVFCQGDVVRVLPAGKTSRINAIVTYDGELDSAVSGMAITLTLEDEIDISRGDIIVGKQSKEPYVADRFKATLVWMAEEPMKPGCQYGFKMGTRHVSGTFPFIDYRIDVNTLDHHDATELNLNEIGVCSVAVIAPVVFDAYHDNKATGSFIVIDRVSNVTVGAGMIAGTLAEDSWTPVTEDQRQRRYGQTPTIIHLFGDRAEQMAYRLERKLFDNGHVVIVLDHRCDELAAAVKKAGFLCLLVSEPCALDDVAYDCSTSSFDEIYESLKNRAIIN